MTKINNTNINNTDINNTDINKKNIMTTPVIKQELTNNACCILSESDSD